MTTIDELRAALEAAQVGHAVGALPQGDRKGRHATDYRSEITMYYVTEVVTCSHCKGCGRISNPQWGEFFATHPAPTGPHNAEQEDAYYALLLAWFNIDDARQLPPEEELCAECEGEGKLTSQVSLEHALKQLGIYDDLRVARRGAEVASMLANGIIPD